MDRNIKFRAWDSVDDRMLSWKELLKDPKLLRMVLDGADLTYTAMQFVGCTDKNNKDVYVGDIIKIYLSSEEFYKCTVFSKNSYSFIMFNNTVMPIYQIPYSFEVMGNIYENK